MISMVIPEWFAGYKFNPRTTENNSGSTVDAQSFRNILNCSKINKIPLVLCTLPDFSTYLSTCFSIYVGILISSALLWFDSGIGKQLIFNLNVFAYYVSEKFRFIPKVCTTLVTITIINHLTWYILNKKNWKTRKESLRLRYTNTCLWVSDVSRK